MEWTPLCFNEHTSQEARQSEHQHSRTAVCCSWITGKRTTKLAAQRERMKKHRATETDAVYTARLADDQHHHQAARAFETETEHAARLADDQQHHQAARAFESETEHAARLGDDQQHTRLHVQPSRRVNTRRDWPIKTSAKRRVVIRGLKHPQRANWPRPRATRC